MRPGTGATGRRDQAARPGAGSTGRRDLTGRHIPPYLRACSSVTWSTATRPATGSRSTACGSSPLEQMQALPYATQLLARLGADVVKVEHPGGGESGAGRCPRMLDPEGRKVGATFLRNNLDKRSVGIDLKHARGPRAVPRARPRSSTSCAENFKAGTMDRLGPRLRRRRRACTPRSIYLSVSGFGNTVDDARTTAGPRTPRSSRRCRASTSTSAEPAEPPPGQPGRRPRRHRHRAVRAPSACSPRCATATAPARASTSTWPCSTPWSP